VNLEDELAAYAIEMYRTVGHGYLYRCMKHWNEVYGPGTTSKVEAIVKAKLGVVINSYS
jgi:hypothetical protein